MDNTILGMNSDSFYALVFLLLLVILGIVTFHYYVFVSTGKGSGLSAGTGLGFTLLPGRGVGSMEEQRQ